MNDLRSLDLRHLRYLVALDDEKHFTRAAARVGIAQPPFSQQIRQLEDIVGARLVERRPHVRLTAVGERLAIGARSVIRDVAETVAAARRVAEGVEGELRLGFASSTLASLLPSIIRSFRAERPQAALVLREMASALQPEAIVAGEIHIGFHRGSLTNTLISTRRIIDEELVAVLPPDHKLGTRKRVRLDELADYQLVMFRRQVAPTLFDQISPRLAQAGINMTTALLAEEWITLVGLVAAGAGVSIAPQSFQRIQWGDVKYVALEDAAGGVDVSCSWMSSNSDPLVAAFLDMV
ncbi:MAG: LysR family transcriptional regulator [Pseudomonadota bacterium]|nr:LysR family transcriptional regulator [Pseudomonadota bacterium]